MKTEVVMKRELFGQEISQKSKSEFFSATDLVKAGNKWRILNDLPAFDDKGWFKNKGTAEFMEALEKRYDIPVKISARGRGKHTWIHPLLFIDMALAISPSLKIEVYEWLFDHLIKNRNDSGDSYKRMSGALYQGCSDKSKFQDGIKIVAKQIKFTCGVPNTDNCWQTASPEQLKKRDKIQDAITLLTGVLNNNNDAVRIGIEKYTEVTFNLQTLNNKT